MRIVVCVSLVFWGVLRAEEAKLPVESELLLKKLEQFEKDTRQKAEEAIEEKRKQVAATLTQQMRSEARAGKVEVAIKIRDNIQKLTPAVVVEEVKLEGPKVPTNEDELTAFLRDSKWKWSNGSFVTFRANGTTLKSNGVYKPNWVVINPRQIRYTCTWEDNGEVFTFNSKFDSFSAEPKKLDGDPSLISPLGKAERIFD